MIIQDLFQEEKFEQKTIQPRCRHGNSDMCTWLSKASDIQAPMDTHKSEAAGGARFTRRGGGVDERDGDVPDAKK